MGEGGLGGVRKAERDSTGRRLSYYDRLPGRIARPGPSPLCPVPEVPTVSPRPHGVAPRGGRRDPEAREARPGPEVNKGVKARIPNLSPSEGFGKAPRPQNSYCGPG